MLNLYPRKSLIFLNIQTNLCQKKKILTFDFEEHNRGSRLETIKLKKKSKIEKKSKKNRRKIEPNPSSYLNSVCSSARSSSSLYLPSFVPLRLLNCSIWDLTAFMRALGEETTTRRSSSLNFSVIV